MSETRLSRGFTAAFGAGALFVGAGALRMGLWESDGPGPGFFPGVAAVISLLCAALVLLRPQPPAALPDADDAPDNLSGDRRNLLVYALALVVMAAGVQRAGYLLTTVIMVAGLLFFGERRSAGFALGYGLGLAGAGWLIFGRLLGVDLPQGPLEQALAALTGGW